MAQVKTSIRILAPALVLAALLAPAVGRSPAGTAASPGIGATPTGDGEAEVPPASPVTEATPASPLPSPDSANPTGDLIEVSIDRQELTAWRDGAVVHRFRVSTGREGYETPTGRFKVRAKYERAWSRKWKVWMPYTLNFFQNYNIHELPHRPGSRTRIGASRLGTPDSHGCVRVGIGDAKLLYDWARIGTPVWIH